MREILFRGKRKDNDEWVEGDLRHGGYYLNDPDIYICVHFADTIIRYPIHPETVSQYTGLKDKNGKRIFEKDIVKVQYTGSNTGDSGIGTVVFENCMFAIPWGWHKDLVCLTGFCNHTIEVVGNIYDNFEEGDLDV